VSCAAGRTQSSRLDDLPFHGKASVFAEPAQAFDDLVVTDLLCRAAIFANHELALMRVVDITAGDIGARRLDLMDQLVSEQEFERAVDGRRPELAAPALQLGKQGVGTGRLIRQQDQLEHPPPDWRQTRAAQRTNTVRSR
jgi:hypothetical protein